LWQLWHNLSNPIKEDSHGIGLFQVVRRRTARRRVGGADDAEPGGGGPGRAARGKRLQQGLPIGSGLIEGAGKTTLARRLKINSARWRVRRAERMGAIRCLQYSGMWEAYWESKQAA